MRGSFLAHRGGFWFWFALALVLLSVGAYAWHEPLEDPNGGTWLGYTLGTIAAVLIVVLALFGARKRAYRLRFGTVKGWLSAHVYLGCAVVVLATLHSGFQFGANIHTLAWALMLVVVLSGLYGAWAYARFPTRITRNRDGLTRELIFDEIADIDRKATRIGDSLGSPVDRMVLSAIDHFRVGGGAWMQVTGRDRSRMMVASPGAQKRWSRVRNPGQQRLLDNLAAMLSRSTDPQESARLQELIDLIARKRRLAQRLVEDIRLHGLMEIWLYLHIPLTAALLAALLAHIVSVFFYR